MANTDRLLSFFEAENQRVWSTYQKYLSPGIIWVLHAKQTKTIVGIDTYLAAIMEAYKDSGNSFVCETLYQSGNGSRIVAILRNNLGERSCDIFEFFDGLIVKEHEFLLA